MEMTAVETSNDHIFKKIRVEDYKKYLNHDSPLDEEHLDMFENIFYTFLDQYFDHSVLSEDLMEIVIQGQNFFPALYNKDVGYGTWIRVKTEEGYNVYFAKKCNKTYSAEKLQRELKKITFKYNSLLGKEDLTSIKSREKLIKKQLNLQLEIQVANVVAQMPSDIHYVKALRTKSQWLYLLPHEYEIISDIQLYVEAVLDKQTNKSVKYRQLFTKQDHDQVFYMQSRGIPKDVAIMMCRLQQCYFVVDTKELFKEWMVPA